MVGDELQLGYVDIRRGPSKVETQKNKISEHSGHSDYLLDSNNARRG
jgi:hypothetical protein